MTARKLGQKDETLNGPYKGELVMKMEFLRQIGLSDEQIQRVMAENGRDIAKEQRKAAKENAVRRGVEACVGKERFTSEFARRAVLAEIWQKELEVGDDGTVLGLDGVLAGIKEANPDAFLEEKPMNPNKLSLSLPPMGAAAGAEKENNPFRRETWNMAEQARLLRENREMALFFQRSAK